MIIIKEELHSPCRTCNECAIISSFSVLAFKKDKQAIMMFECIPPPQPKFKKFQSLLITTFHSYLVLGVKYDTYTNQQQAYNLINNTYIHREYASNIILSHEPQRLCGTPIRFIWGLAMICINWPISCPTINFTTTKEYLYSANASDGEEEMKKSTNLLLLLE